MGLTAYKKHRQGVFLIDNMGLRDLWIPSTILCYSFSWHKAMLTGYGRLVGAEAAAWSRGPVARFCHGEAAAKDLHFLLWKKPTVAALFASRWNRMKHYETVECQASCLAASQQTADNIAALRQKLEATEALLDAERWCLLLGSAVAFSYGTRWTGWPEQPLWQGAVWRGTWAGRGP